MKRPEIPDLLIPLTFSGIVLLASILVGQAYNTLPLRNVLFGIAIIIGIIVGLFGLVIAFENKRHKSEFDLVINRLKEIIPPTNLPWLYSDVELAKAETETKGNNIWIVSPDLANIADKQIIINAVKKNIKRGIQYTYIVPDSEAINGVIPSLLNIFGSHERLLKLIRLSEDSFRLLSVTHIAIFNANMANGVSPEVFIELPIEDTSSQKLRGYWVKVSKGAALGITGRFRKIVENHNAVSQ